MEGACRYVERDARYDAMPSLGCKLSPRVQSRWHADVVFSPQQLPVGRHQHRRNSHRSEIVPDPTPERRPASRRRTNGGLPTDLGQIYQGRVPLLLVCTAIGSEFRAPSDAAQDAWPDRILATGHECVDVGLCSLRLVLPAVP